MNYNVEAITDCKGILGEGPCWDSVSKLLYWVDIAGKSIHVYNPAIDTDRAVYTGQYVGCLVLCKDGGFIAAMENGFYHFDDNLENMSFVADPESHIPGNRFNDGKCDCQGRLWAGTMGKKHEEKAGALYCMYPDKQIKKVFDGVTISNGLTWSPDNKTMYYIDSPTREVWAFDFDVKSGNISNKRAVIRLSGNEGVPDGMTTDSEGMLWVAQWGGWQVSRWNPQTGERLLSIPIPAACVSCCTFGGENMDELYVTTSKRDLKQEDFINQPDAGRIFRIKTDFKGLDCYRFVKV